MPFPSCDRCARRASAILCLLLIVAAALVNGISARAQMPAKIQFGTIIFADFVPDEITIAADSRTTTLGGDYNDNECKISAFGDRFVFTMAGISAKPGVWSAHDLARNAWQAEATPDQTVGRKVVAVAQHWLDDMEKVYDAPDIIRAAQQLNPDNGVLATALFGASDAGAGVVLAAITIHYDRDLYASTGQIRFLADARIVNPPNWVAGGHSEIVDEFMNEQTDRAKSYMDDLRMQIADQDPSAQRAATAARLVELSVQLQPQSTQLGLPVDVVQLGAEGGVRWIQRKDNCSAN